MNIAIVGFELEGRVSYEYFKARGHALTICDQDPEKSVPEDASAQLGADYLHSLDRFDLIVRSAGIQPSVLLADNPGVKDRITTAVDEFFAATPTRNIIGITGTKGKGTTSTLTAKMLEAAGKRVFLGGNIGRSPLEFIDELVIEDWVVLELSSFQLSDLKHSPHIGVCLMVVPEHLNWHADMEDYVAAKSHLFAKQSANDIAIFYAESETSRQIASNGDGQKLPFFAAPGAIVRDGNIVTDGRIVCATSDLKLLGEHNWQNACAAVTAAWQVTQDLEAIRGVLTTFTGLPHRLELVRELDGVKYFNDSFAATPDAAIAALQAIVEPKVIILGGFDRMLPLEHLAEALQKSESIQHALLVGQSATRLAEVCQKIGFTNYTITATKTMADIVLQARSFAHPGSAVLLSPGFASFDMFKNFEDRGEQFKSEVRGL